MDTYAHDAAVAAWLTVKAARSGSGRTRAAYTAVMAAFRAALLRDGLDLSGPAERVAAVASTYAGSSARGRQVSAATYNLRLAILSSFYEFAHKRRLLIVSNPIALVERRPVESYARVKGLDYAEVKARLAGVDRTTFAGLRDYALLAILLQTGRRAAEVAALQVRDVQFRPDGTAHVTWWRCKGGKTMEDLLPAAIAGAVRAWVAVADDEAAAPLFHALGIAGTPRPLSHTAIAAICLRHLGTSRVHATRHTFARAMEDSGAKVSDIQARLGHSSLQTTGRYLTALRRAENSHAGAVGGLLGLD